MTTMADERTAPGPAAPGDSWWQRLLARFRGLGVGTEDPNIVGDAGPYDVAPGRDPHPEAIPVEEADEPLPAETAFASEEVGLPPDDRASADDADAAAYEPPPAYAAEPMQVVPGDTVPGPDEVPPPT
jgi:hypothetical protein